MYLLFVLLLLICFTVYLSAAFIEWFYVYIAVMSVLTRDKFLNFIDNKELSYTILSYLDNNRVAHATYTVGEFVTDSPFLINSIQVNAMAPPIR